jgi:two-component system chemotaxis response regulator CheB
MPATFTASLAARLDRASAYHVREAAQGDKLAPGVALVAPGGRHLEFDHLGVAQITDTAPVHSVRPSVDVTLFSLEKVFGKRMVAVLLTGMGRDGAAGLKAIQAQGGKTLVEDESSCVVFGMPKAAIEIGAAQRVVPLGEMADAIVESFAVIES